MHGALTEMHTRIIGFVQDPTLRTKASLNALERALDRIRFGTSGCTRRTTRVVNFGPRARRAVAGWRRRRWTGIMRGIIRRIGVPRIPRVPPTAAAAAATATTSSAFNKARRFKINGSQGWHSTGFTNIVGTSGATVTWITHYDSSGGLALFNGVDRPRRNGGTRRLRTRIVGRMIGRIVGRILGVIASLPTAPIATLVVSLIVSWCIVSHGRSVGVRELALVLLGVGGGLDVCLRGRCICRRTSRQNG